MTCANCFGDSWRRPLESLDGVIEANANFATDEGSVEYDPDEVSLAEIFTRRSRTPATVRCL